MKKKFVMFLAVAMVAMVATSAHAALVVIEYDFLNMTGATVSGDTLTYTGANANGTQLIITAIGSFTGTSGRDVNLGPFGLAVTGGVKGGSNADNLISFNSGTGDTEALTISFDKDVTLNFGGDVGSFTTNKATNGDEALRFTLTVGGGTDAGSDGAPVLFSNITTLAAGQTLTVTSENAGGNATVALAALSVYTVPEPATMSLLALGGLSLIRRRKRA